VFLALNLIGCSARIFSYDNKIPAQPSQELKSTGWVGEVTAFALEPPTLTPEPQRKEKLKKKYFAVTWCGLQQFDKIACNHAATEEP
jgi:hypothetical protein